MKTMMLSWAVSLIVLLTACNKESRNVPSRTISQNQEALITNRLNSPCANEANPFDYLGYLHNVVLDSLRQYVKTTKDTSRLGKAAFLNRYFKNTSDGEFKPFYIPEEKTGCTNYKAILLGQHVSITALEFLQALCKTLDSIHDLDHYEDYKKQIEQAEAKIMGAELPDSERTNLLMTAAILRYSGYYWMNAFKNGSVQQHGSSQMASTDSFLRKIAGVIAGIGADASVIAYCYMTGDIEILDKTVTWSEVCGYYTGWW
jgi:hypothetical protein